jgi:hypothetical protein
MTIEADAVEDSPASAFRVLARQPLSLDVDGGAVMNVEIQGVDCLIAVEASHSDEAKQKELGGSTLAIEFLSHPDLDLFDAARAGLELIEDFLSAVTVVSGTTFAHSELLQVARRDQREGANCEFAIHLPLPLKHWHERISEGKLSSVRNLLAHWDGLESGHRLRRAARNYRSAAGNPDHVSAFQQAYVGLEVLEKPLATMAGFKKHGTEEVTGTCENCGHEYNRNRTVLVGVRAFVHGDVDPKAAEAGRKADWKLMNNLRNDLAHGLVDDDELGDRPTRGLTTAMHYLHHAICVSSHAHDLTSDRYVLARGGREYVLMGRYTAGEWPPLSDWRQVVDISDFTWVRHATHGLVPQTVVNVKGIADLEVYVGRLRKPIAMATVEDIEPTPIEHD